MIFNNVLFDRPPKLPVGGFAVTPVACFQGTSGPVTWPDGTGTLTLPGGGATCSMAVGQDLAATVTSTTPGGTSVSCAAGISVAQCINNFQTAYQAAQAAAGPSVANANFIGNTLPTGSPLPTASLFWPQYKTPRSVQMNVGVQRELRPGMVVTVDYVRNVGLHYLLAIDANYAGDAAFLNVPAAQAAVASTLAACGAATITAAAAPGGCVPLHPIGPGSNGAASITDFAGNGLDSPGDLTGGASCGSPASGVAFQCAFGGINPNFGSLQFFYPGGRSVYNAMDIKFVENKANPFRGVKYLNFQASYTLSRFDNAGGASATNPGNPAAGDQDFLTTALDFRNPLQFIGPSTLDRTHQLNFGGYADLPPGFRVGMIAHFW